MDLKNRGIFLAMLCAVLNIGWAMIPNRPPIIGTILALPLVLFFPGYTLTAVLFHKRYTAEQPDRVRPPRPLLGIGRPIDTAESLVLSLGLSLAIDILCGFVLNALPSGLHGISWAVTLGLLTALLALLAASLRRRGSEKSGAEWSGFRISLSQGLLFGLTIAVLLLSVWYSVFGAVQQPRPGFTQMWLTPSSQPKNTCAVSIGVKSFESNTVTYRVTVTVNGELVDDWTAITLTPQQEWDQQLSLMPRITENMYIEAQLFQMGNPGKGQRDVHLTMYLLNGSSGNSGPQCADERTNT